MILEWNVELFRMNTLEIFIRWANSFCWLRSRADFFPISRKTFFSTIFQHKFSRKKKEICHKKKFQNLSDKNENISRENWWILLENSTKLLKQLNILVLHHWHLGIPHIHGHNNFDDVSLLRYDGSPISLLGRWIAKQLFTYLFSSLSSFTLVISHFVSSLQQEQKIQKTNEYKHYIRVIHFCSNNYKTSQND